MLLLTVSKPRRIRKDAIHFQGFRYMSLTLAAYVGEDVVIRYDPRDISEIRVYHGSSFLCRATGQELSGETISLKEIIAARNRRRRELKGVISERTKIVDRFISVHGRETLPHEAVAEPTAPKPSPEIRRYFNE